MDQFEFRQLFPNLQWEVVMKMDDRELVNLCRSSKEMETFCNTRSWFWRDRIVAQFGLDPFDPSDPTIQTILTNNGNNWFLVYFLLLRLSKLKTKLSPHLDIYSLTDLYNLQELNLTDNRLTEIPREIGNLTNLQTLILSYNQLTELPREISNLTNLQYLHLDNNHLTEIPREIGNLTNLQYLGLSGNQLSDPDRIKQWLPNVKIYL